MMVLGLTLAAAVAVWVWARLLIPMEEACGVAERLAQGDARARAPSDAPGSLGRLGAALDRIGERMADAARTTGAEQAALTAVLDAMVEGVLAVGADGKILFINPALAALLKVRPDDALGRPYAEVARQAGLAELLEQALARSPSAREVVLFAPEERTFEGHAAPMTGAGRAGAVLVLHEVTRLKALEGMRRDFVANVSHELRTPLASIRASAETALEAAADDPETRGEFLATVISEADRLTALIDDVLDLSAIESGRRQLKLEPLDVLAVAREAASRLRARAEERGVALEVQAEAPPKARADRDQLAQVFVNLLDNAIKYNRDGGSVRVSARVEDERLVVEVQDTGVGIPAAHLPRIFERFYRVDTARSRELGGTGLGLSIVKHLVEANGGMISAESAEGAGSSFRFTLQLA